MLYIHYWFANSGIPIQDYSAQKTIALQNARKVYDARQKNRINQATKGNNATANKMLELYDDLLEGNILGQSLESKLAEIMSQKTIVPTAAAKAATINGITYSFAQLGSLSDKIKEQLYQQGFRKTSELASSLGEIIPNIESIADDILQTLSTEYKKAYKYAIDCVAKNGLDSLPTSQRGARKLVQETLAKGSGVQWIDSSDLTANELSLAKAYVRLKKRINALKMLNLNGGLANYTVSNTEKMIGVLIGKTGGTLNNAAAATHELAVGAAAGALLQRELEIGDRFKNIVDASISGVTGGARSGIHIEKQKDESPEMKILRQKIDFMNKNSGSFNKNDVTVVYSIDGVVLDFGISAKTTAITRFSNSSKKKNITIHDTTLMRIFEDARRNSLGSLEVFSEYNIFNIASSQSKNENVEDYNISGLTRMWRSLADYAIALNFVDYLAGDGSAYSNSVLMVVNNKIFTIPQVIDEIIGNPTALSRNVYESISGGVFNRLEKQNIWVGGKVGERRNQKDAKTRSDATERNLTAAFNATKIKIRIDLANLMLTK